MDFSELPHVHSLSTAGDFAAFCVSPTSSRLSLVVIVSRNRRRVTAETNRTQRKDIMKKFSALILVIIGVATSARAQWVVYDPTLHTQSILNTAQEIAKYIEMINNQWLSWCSLSGRFCLSNTDSLGKPFSCTWCAFSRSPRCS